MVALRCPLHPGLVWVDHMPSKGLERSGAVDRVAASGADGRGADGCTHVSHLVADLGAGTTRSPCHLIRKQLPRAACSLQMVDTEVPASPSSVSSALCGITQGSGVEVSSTWAVTADQYTLAAH